MPMTRSTPRSVERRDAPGSKGAFDPDATAETLAETLRGQVRVELHRRGLVVGMSGGVDSSVCAALAVRALGPDRVFGLFMPEADSDPESVDLAREWATELGIEWKIEDITPALEAFGCYRRRDAAIRRLVPDFSGEWGCKLVLPRARGGERRLNVFYLVVAPPGGEERRLRLPAREYREIVAATNFKQRVRKTFEYYHADRLHYAVLGTPNRLEFDQGFFVKGGDGLADVKPIAHLYKHQVYRLADALGVPPGITDRPPTTDTFSLPQRQEEFYFSVPLPLLDRVMEARDAGLGVDEIADRLDLSGEEVEAIVAEIEAKRKATRYLHRPALLAESVPSIAGQGEAG